MVDQLQLQGEKRKFPFENASIEVLDLSTGFKHALMRHGILMIYDLIMHLSTLNEVPHIGPKAQQEIKVKLFAWVREKIGMTSQKVLSAPPHEDTKENLSKKNNIELKDLLSILLDKKAKSRIENASIDDLDLIISVKNILLRKGIHTIYNLVIHLSTLEQWYQVGQKVQSEIKVKLTSWALDNIVNILPQGASGTPNEIGLPEQPKEDQVQLNGLLSTLTARQRKILNFSFGLENGQTVTLKKTADGIGISCQVARQNKIKAIAKLQKEIFRIKHLAFCEKVAEYVSQKGGVLSEKRLVDELNGDSVLCGFYASGVLELFKEFKPSCLQIGLIYLNEISGWTTSVFSQNLIECTAVEIKKIIKQALVPIEWQSLYRELLRTDNLFTLNEQLALAVTICLEDSGILDRTEDGRWFLKGFHSYRRKEQLVNTLIQMGHPAHFREIAQVQQKLFPNEIIDDHAVLSVLQQCFNTFSRVGRGKYGLVQWGLSNDGTIANAVRRILVENNNPMTFADICNEVRKTWEVVDFSINSAIQNDARFSRIEDGKIWLTKKGHTVEKIAKRSDEGRRERLVEVLRSLKTIEHTSVIVEKHNESFPENPLTEYAVYSILITNPTLFVRVGTASFALKEWDLKTIPAKVKSQHSNRKGCLIQTMKELGRPARLQEIIQKYNSLFPDDPIAEPYTRTLLWKHGEIFMQCRKGIYELAKTN